MPGPPLSPDAVEVVAAAEDAAARYAAFHGLPLEFSVREPAR